LKSRAMVRCPDGTKRFAMGTWGQDFLFFIFTKGGDGGLSGVVTGHPGLAAGSAPAPAKDADLGHRFCHRYAGCPTLLLEFVCLGNIPH
jgi:hypothetical protein